MKAWHDARDCDQTMSDCVFNRLKPVTVFCDHAQCVRKHDISIEQYTIDLKRREEMYSFHCDSDGLHPLFPPYLFVESGIVFTRKLVSARCHELFRKNTVAAAPFQPYPGDWLVAMSDLVAGG